MKYSISILSEAQIDIDTTVAWYELKQQGLGYLYFTVIDKSIQLIARHPFASQEIYKGLRRLVIKKFPYGIYYKIVPNKLEIQIIAIIHFRRNTKIIRRRL